MRLGWRVPLPGPFSVSGRIGGRRRRGGGCLPWLGLALLIGVANEYPWLWAVAGVLAAAVIALAVIRRR